MSNYPVPPPSYGTSDPRKNNNEVQEPLLGESSRGGFGGFYDQPASGELPDDFKVSTFIWRLYSTHHLQVWRICL
jgi:hypothetical protein